MKTTPSLWERGAAIVALCCFSGILLSFAGTAAGTNPPEAAVQTPSEAAVPAAETSPPPPAAKGSKGTEEALQSKVKEALLRETFSYPSGDLLDPFIPFISAVETPPPQITSKEEADTELPPEQQRPLTPLQKMTLAEIEKGLRAITWGDLGRKAIIEDAAGKGYIVGIGTPVGDKNGVVTQIFNDRLVIQQEVYDRQSKKMVAVNSVVKIKKAK